jgi:hypothetical protein
LEDASTAARWADIVRLAAIRGKRAHDARIAALMATHGITRLLTLMSLTSRVWLLSPQFTRALCSESDARCMVVGGFTR